MTSSNGIIFRVTGPLCEEFTGHRWIPSQRPVTRSFDVFFHLCPNKRLSKQSWGWWFETQSCSLWRHCDNSYTTNSGVNTCCLMLFTFSHSIVLPSWCKLPSGICKWSSFGFERDWCRTVGWEPTGSWETKRTYGLPTERSCLCEISVGRGLLGYPGKGMLLSNLVMMMTYTYLSAYLPPMRGGHHPLVLPRKWSATVLTLKIIARTSWRIKTRATRLFIHRLVITKLNKAPHYCPFVSGISSHNGKCRKGFHVITPSWKDRHNVRATIAPKIRKYSIH